MKTYAEVKRGDKWHDSSLFGAFPLFCFVLLSCFALLRYSHRDNTSKLFVHETTEKFVALASVIAIAKIWVTIMGFSETDPMYKILANIYSLV